MKALVNSANTVVGENGASLGAVYVRSSKKVDISQFDYKGQYLKALDDFIGSKA